MEELRAALAQPGFQRLVEALDACEEIEIPMNDLADAKQEFRIRQGQQLEESEDKVRAAMHEEVELDGPIARDDKTEVRERVVQQKKKTSKGGGVAADPKEGARPVERRSLGQRLGLFSEIRHSKE